MRKSLKKTRSESPCTLDSTAVHPALTSIFSYSFHKAALRLKELLNKELERHDLIGAHIGILRLLEALGSLSQNDLGEQMSIDKASMVKFIDHLEKQKLVIRRPDKTDRRVKYIELIPKGVDMLVKTKILRQKIELKFLDVLDADERATLMKAIPKLLRK